MTAVTGERGPNVRVGTPAVAVVGRPNVGKSTLVNRIVGRRVAIVEERPGVTRDRIELRTSWAGSDFVLVDTGGVVERGDELDTAVTEQAQRAIARADLVLLVVDASVGVTDEDEAVAGVIRRAKTPTIVVANKVDSKNDELGIWDLARLGLGEPAGVSALHGRGVGDLLDRVVAGLEDLSLDEDRAVAIDEPDVSASVAVVGRPNVGKSTLFNRLVGEERSIVHDVAGTTRDTIDTIVDTDVGRIRFVDTAGVRRKSQIDESTEYYSFVRSLAAIDRSDVALLVLDATEPVSQQDQRLAERVDAAGSPIVVVLNKWDLCSTERRLEVAREVEDRLSFIAWAPVLRVSAKTGLGANRVFPALRSAIDAYHRRISTAELNSAIRAIQTAHAAPGARILYAVQGAIDPPTITLFVNHRLAPSYLRYIERSLRERFELGPTALKLRVRLRGS